MAYRTGRTRGVFYEFALSANRAINIDNRAEAEDEDVIRPSANTALAVQTALGSVIVNPIFTDVRTPEEQEQDEDEAGEEYQIKVGWRVEINGTTHDLYDPTPRTVAANAISSFAWSLSATVLCTGTAEQLIGDAGMPHSDGAVVDAPEYTRVAVWERLQPGSQRTISINAGLYGSASSSVGVGDPPAVPPDPANKNSYGPYLRILTAVANATGGGTATASISPGGTNCPAVYPGNTYGSTTAAGTATATGPCTAVAASAALDGDQFLIHGPCFCTIGGNTHGARAADCGGAIFALSSGATAYPDPLQIAVGGWPAAQGAQPAPATAWGFGVTQRHWDWGWSPNGVAYASTVDEWSPVSFGLARTGPNSLAAVGDEPLASRLLVRGRQFGGISLSQSSLGYNIDPMADGLVTGTGGATAALTDGSDGPVRLRVVTAGTTGGATRAYSPPKSFTGYRYLDMSLRSVGHADVPVTLTLGGYAWNLTTGADGEAVTRRIDLCAPDGSPASALNDGWDARWPYPTATSPTSGPWRVSSASLSGIPAGRVVECDYLRLVRASAATADWMPTLYPATKAVSGGLWTSVANGWPLIGPARSPGDGGTSTDHARRFLCVNADGRAPALEEFDGRYVQSSFPDSVATVVPLHNTIATLAAEITTDRDMPPDLAVAPWLIGAAEGSGEPRYPGWGAAVSVPVPSAYVPTGPVDVPPAVPHYYNAGRPAAWLHGGGLLYSHAGGWQIGLDLPLGAVQAQALYDVVDWHPAAGDVFGVGDGGATDAIVLRFGGVLRAAAHGLAFAPDRSPKVGQSVELRQDGATVSSGKSRADGYYATAGTPAGKPPGGSGAVRPAGETAPTVSLGALYTRRRHRASLIAESEAPPRCDLLASEPTYFPFTPQFSDSDALPSAVAPRSDARGILPDRTVGGGAQRHAGNGKEGVRGGDGSDDVAT